MPRATCRETFHHYLREERHTMRPTPSMIPERRSGIYRSSAHTIATGGTTASGEGLPTTGSSNSIVTGRLGFVCVRACLRAFDCTVKRRSQEATGQTKAVRNGQRGLKTPEILSSRTLFAGVGVRMRRERAWPVKPLVARWARIDFGSRLPAIRGFSNKWRRLA